VHKHLHARTHARTQVLVRVTHAGINGGCETFRVRGEHAFAGNRAKHEYALGAEGAGVVVALGEQVRQQQQQQQQGQQQQQQQQGAGVAVGQRVAVNGGAAFAEFCVVPAASVTPVTCSAPEAVALTLSALTAAAALQETARVQPREVVLVTAAAGGTGHFGVQLAQLAGARVVAVAGGAAKKERLAALGLERVIDYKCEDVAAVLAAEYPQGVDVVYEGVGGALRAAIMRHLAPGARVLQVRMRVCCAGGGASLLRPRCAPRVPPLQPQCGSCVVLPPPACFCDACLRRPPACHATPTRTHALVLPPAGRLHIGVPAHVTGGVASSAWRPADGPVLLGRQVR
jgi:NADPH:quinone reductase-like Zn-dependent oxidoreductase